MNHITQREKFEAWHGPHGLSRNNTPGSDLDGYQCSYTNMAWKAWQAALAQPVGINGLTEAETDSSMSVRGLSKPSQPELMVDMTPPATSRDRWMYEQGRLAERDPRSHVAQPEPVEPQPRLKVRLRAFPESNGKQNWTALLVREQHWNGLVGNCGGITIAYGELWNRVAYAAERAKFLIGERDTEPSILDYGDDIKTPADWNGEIDGGRMAAAKGGV